MVDSSTVDGDKTVTAAISASLLDPEKTRRSSFLSPNLRKARVLEVPIQVWRKYGFILLWAAVGLDLIFSVIGHPYVGQAISALFVIIYLFDNVSLRRVVCSLWFAIIDLYFREISVGGSHKLESLKDGRGVVFAIAPHVNQFVDPIVVMKVVAQKTRRHVSFLTAAVSFQRKYIGAFARAMKGIPVVRPDDQERAGPGFITAEGLQVRGHGGTTFTKTLGRGYLVIVKCKGFRMTGKVAQVVDDASAVLTEPMRYQAAAVVKGEHKEVFDRMPSYRTTLAMLVLFSAVCGRALAGVMPSEWRLLSYACSFHLACLLTSLVYVAVRDGVWKDSSSGKEAASPSEVKAEQGGEAPIKSTRDLTEPSAYSVQPSVDQTSMFEQVYDSLLSGGTIGVFPEGGTHDGTQLLPLKWGISTMVLGAMAKHSGSDPIKISVVPVGVNYFHPHKFRSTVSVDFGDPIDISPALAEQWKKGTKEGHQKAAAAVMDLVMNGINACTLQAKDVTTLDLFRTLRRLVVDGGRLSVADNVALTQGIASHLNRSKDEPRVRGILERCRQYSSMLHQYQVQDHQVQRLKGQVISDRELLVTTLARMCLVTVFSAVLLPYWLSVAPAGLFLSVISDMKAKQVGKMSVKGTWKVLLSTVVVPLLHVECTVIIWVTFGELAGLLWFFLGPVLVTFAIFAAEESGRIFRSVNVLLLLLRRKDIGLQLYEFREKLKAEVLALKEEQNWLGSLDAVTRKQLEERESLHWGNGSPSSAKEKE